MSAHPLFWLTKLFYYPIGNTSAVCLTQDLPPWQPADVLLLGCGDARNILYTVFADMQTQSSTRGYRKLDITCCDIEPAILARNIFLFSLLMSDSPFDQLWNIYYHFYFDESSFSLLETHSHQLAQAAESLESWNKSEFGRHIHILTNHTLSEVRQCWSQYATFRNLSVSRMEAFQQELTQLSNSVITKYSTNILSSRSAGPLWPEASVPVSKQFTRFWKTGTTFTSDDRIKCATQINPTFIYSLSGEKVNPHYGSFPPSGFHLFEAFSPTISESSGGFKQKQQFDSFSASHRQFNTWCASFRNRIKSDNPSLDLSFYAGDAIAFCRALDIYNKGGNK